MERYNTQGTFKFILTLLPYPLSKLERKLIREHNALAGRHVFMIWDKLIRIKPVIIHLFLCPNKLNSNVFEYFVHRYVGDLL